MSLNNDFSFVRFLKVVKTLYESSVFTRIGKTIGSEHDKQIPARDEETIIETVGSLETLPDDEKLSENRKMTFFEKLCSPATLAQSIINCTLQAEDDISQDGSLRGDDDDRSTFSYES